jgi:UDP-N-acetyl-D-glucosamine/UDP-N-acetyl-D-galactosamine dehydrogenase
MASEGVGIVSPLPGKERIGVVGLGYVGLPLALALAKNFDVQGFDIDQGRIAELQKGVDRTLEITKEGFDGRSISFSATPADLETCTMLIVTVPTPVDAASTPDLGALRSASKTVAGVLKPGMVVVYESTVYPGATEEVCLPILEELSGLKLGKDFALGYSPERINPGDHVHTIENVIKVVSASDPASLDRVCVVYEAACKAGVHRASSIRVAEAAKVIENTQRDLNIALINELALIFDRLGLSTTEVLEAAGTKWNFLKFTPGLVGGHCIGVDPYYLTYKAAAVGYHPEVILAGRRVNDRMGEFIAQKTMKLLVAQGKGLGARIGVLGLTFKENVPDLRNSKVPDVIAELKGFGVDPLVADPMASAAEAQHEYGLSLVSLDQFTNLDAVIVAVPHTAYQDLDLVLACVKPGGVIIDVKSCLDRNDSRLKSFQYWSL